MGKQYRDRVERKHEELSELAAYARRNDLALGVEMPPKEEFRAKAEAALASGESFSFDVLIKAVPKCK